MQSPPGNLQRKITHGHVADRRLDGLLDLIEQRVYGRWCRQAPGRKKLFLTRGAHGFQTVSYTHLDVYKRQAAYGHFGRDEPEFTWEGIDKAAELKKAAG